MTKGHFKIGHFPVVINTFRLKKAIPAILRATRTRTRAAEEENHQRSWCFLLLLTVMGEVARLTPGEPSASLKVL